MTAIDRQRLFGFAVGVGCQPRQTCCRCLNTTTDYDTRIVERRTDPARFHTCKACVAEMAHLAVIEGPTDERP